MPNNNLAHFAINADDVNRARTFYEKVFNWKFEPWGPPGFFQIFNADKSEPGVRGALQGRRELVFVAGEPDIIGFGHVAGRQLRRAELVAVFDALLQTPSRRDAVAAEIVAPLAARQQAARAALAAKLAPSKVDFLTVVRGE